MYICSRYLVSSLDQPAGPPKGVDTISVCHCVLQNSPARSTWFKMENLSGIAVKGDPSPPTVQVMERDVDVAIIGTYALS